MNKGTHPLLSLFCIFIAIVFFVVMIWSVICLVRFIVALTMGT